MNNSYKDYGFYIGLLYLLLMTFYFINITKETPVDSPLLLEGFGNYVSACRTLPKAVNNALRENDIQNLTNSLNDKFSIAKDKEMD